MATSETTNLQLVKYGAGTDNFIRTDYNGNLDKIDTFAGNTNEAIANNATAIGNYVTAGGVSKYISTGSMDDIKTPGRYFYANQLTSRPSTSDGYLDVYALNANYIKQVAHESITYKMYVRYCNNGTWSAWQELALKSDIPNTNVQVGGLTTNVATTFSLTKNFGCIIIKLPQTASSATGYMYFFAKHNGYVNIYSLSPSTAITITTSGGSISITTSHQHGGGVGIIEYGS